MRHYILALFLLISCWPTSNGYCGLLESTADRSLSKVFQKVNPAVVLIIAMQRPQSLYEAKPPATVSSGVIVSKQGEVMTAAHSVYVSDNIIVQFHDGRSVKANVVSSSAEADVALLKLETIPENMAVARLGEEAEGVYLVGFDVKALRTTTPDKRYQHLINSKIIFEHLLSIVRSLDNAKIEEFRAKRDYETLELYIVEKLMGK